MTRATARSTTPTLRTFPSGWSILGACEALRGRFENLHYLGGLSEPLAAVVTEPAPLTDAYICYGYLFHLGFWCDRHGLPPPSWAY